MFRSLLLLTLTLPLLAADPPKREFERLSPKFDELVPKDAVVEELADGFKWSEGPVWNAKQKKLYFSDIPNNRVMTWSDTEKLKEFLKPAGYTGTKDFGGREPGSNGLAFDKDGNLILCQHGDRRVARLKDGKFETIASHYDGKRLNSPNDLVFNSKGQMYFTDPPYGLTKGMEDPEKELDFQGVYFQPSKGDTVLLTKEMSRPNGIALSPDEKTLYVANSDPKKAIWMKFPLKDNGSLDGHGSIFFDATGMMGKERPGSPDGMKIDKDGNLWATGPGGVFVFDRDGKHLGTILTHAPTANCAWGGDGSTLYMTANDRLIRVKTKARGW